MSYGARNSLRLVENTSVTGQEPAPLTPPDCNVRSFPAMLLDVAALRDSDFAAHPNAEVFRCGVLAWCAAFHQVPAASLPDDNAAIARLIGLGRDAGAADRFAALREAGALHGFVKCSDGRLYHPVIAEKVFKALESKAKNKAKTEAATAARLAKQAALRDEQRHVNVTNDVTSTSRHTSRTTSRSTSRQRDEGIVGHQPNQTEPNRTEPKGRKGTFAAARCWRGEEGGLSGPGMGPCPGLGWFRGDAEEKPPPAVRPCR